MFKTVLSISLVLLLNVSLKAQDTIRLVHKRYTTVFSKSLKYPVLVEWWLTKEALICVDEVPRSERFYVDPFLATETNLANDYIRSGFDRGHMAPSADNQCFGPIVMKECFYFSNIAPQAPNLNQGDWKTLEDLTRTLTLKYDSVKVWAGSVGEQKKIGRVSVPQKCWKVIYIHKTRQWFYYIFDNNNMKPNGIEDNKTTLQEIQKITNLKFRLK